MSESNVNSHKFLFDTRQACIEQKLMAVFIPTDPVMLLLASISAMFVLVNESTGTYVIDCSIAPDWPTCAVNHRAQERLARLKSNARLNTLNDDLPRLNLLGRMKILVQ